MGLLFKQSLNHLNIGHKDNLYCVIEFIFSIDLLKRYKTNSSSFIKQTYSSNLP